MRLDRFINRMMIFVSATLVVSNANGDPVPNAVSSLVESSCIQCHDGESESSLDFNRLTFRLDDAETFRVWERVFDRVTSGEMPPDSEERPDQTMLKNALGALHDGLESKSRKRQQAIGRVPARRLTKLEFGYTLQDLLQIKEDVTSGVPDEAESGTFDTVGTHQRISAVHMESYLDAADAALDAAIRLGKSPQETKVTSYLWLEAWHNKPLIEGGSITKKLETGNGVVLFRDIDYLTQFQFNPYNPFGGALASGLHRLTAKVGGYQTDQTLTAKIVVKGPGGEARMVKAADIPVGEIITISVEVGLKPGEIPYLTYVDPGSDAVFTAGGAQHYKGPGLAIYEQKVDGPLFESWPPSSTRSLLHGVSVKPVPSMLNAVSGLFGGANVQSLEYEAKPTKETMAHVSEVVEHIAPRIFRRPIVNGELEEFVNLARPAIEQKRPLLEVLRVPLRSMISSPQFLLFQGEPGELDEYALATRLSYFLWKSLPDQELFELAASGALSEPDVLASQVDRMLDDDKSDRFIEDFLGQWLLLHKVNATTPDDGLYPEFDELLSTSIPVETRLFFRELLANNLSARNLIDSDFVMVNRRLAEHYGIAGVKGQEFRRVSLPEDSPRGGVLTQAAILKTTANGTNTSPVMRGNFVLTNFLGTPPSPPPPDVGSIEPDTRGKTTIREVLVAHRDIASCNQCHREIDPPGFALESFDPIGGFRDHYRVSGGEVTFNEFTTKLPPKPGLPVDASGMTSGGDEFKNIQDFKRLMLKENDQVARHLISQFVVYATGAEIQFADREVIDKIQDQTKTNGYRVRDLLHAVVQSRLFREL